MLSYSLRRLVCPDDQAQIVLNCNENTTLDIVADMNMYFKINVESKQAPGVLNIKYA